MQSNLSYHNYLVYSYIYLIISTVIDSLRWEVSLTL